MKPIIFCFFNTEYSSRFLLEWVKTVDYLLTNKIQFRVIHGESCNAFYAKQACLGGNVLSGEDQKPFDGKLEYSALFFISNNIIWKLTDIINIYNTFNSKKLDVLSANINNLESEDKIQEVEHVDFDFCIIRYGVFERLKYPWFIPHMAQNRDETLYREIGICKKFVDNNIIINVHCEVCLDYE
jgi:hypothetical protein